MKKFSKIKPLPARKLIKLDLISNLVADGEFSEAKELLETFSEKDKDHPFYKSALVFFYYVSGDYHSALRHAYPLQKHSKHGDADHLFYLLSLYASDFIALAYQELNAFKKKPRVDLDNECLANFQKIERHYETLMPAMPIENANPDSIMAQQDLCRLSMFLNDMPNAETYARKIISECPGFLPARNNLSLCFFHQGKTEEALEQVKIVLQDKPDYYFALDLKFHYETILGLDAHFPDISLILDEPGLADKLSLYLRDFRFQEISRFLGEINYKTIEEHVESREAARAINYLGYAEWMLCNTNKAIELWEYAEINLPYDKKLMNNLNESEEDSLDINVFSLQDTIPNYNFSLLIKNLEADADTYCRKYQKLIKSFLLLGNHDAMDLAINLISLCKEDIFDTDLKTFIEGQRGNYDLRLRATSIVTSRKGPQNYRVYKEGEYCEVMAKTTTPRDIEYPPEVEEILIKTKSLISKHKYKKAETILETAILKFPYIARLYNHLAVAKDALGKKLETREIVEFVGKQFPDYPTGQINLGDLRLREGKGEEATRILERVLARTDLHIPEIEACNQLHQDLAKAGFLPSGK